MSRTSILRGFLVLALVGAFGTAAPIARAQGPLADAGAEAPAPTATSERPVRGPSVRERGGSRSRGASTASGVLMLVMLIGFMGSYVVKKLRR